MKNLNQLLAAIEQDFFCYGHFLSHIPSNGDSLRKLEKPPLAETRTFANDKKNKIEILRRNFRAIPASPQNGGLYRIAYCFPKLIPPIVKVSENLFNSPFTLSHSPNAINDPDINPRDLAESLAIRCRTLLSDFRHTECHLISGERGVGKTAFLNYLFSTQHAVFDEHKVIWVRIDLTLAQALSMTIKEILDVHTYDIIVSKYFAGGAYPLKTNYFDDDDYEHAFKQYFQRSRDFSTNELKKYLKNRIEAGGSEDYLEYWSFLISADKAELKSIDIDYDEKRRRVTIYRDFFQSKEFCFLYVIDGLDEATIPMQKANVLKKWRYNIFDIMQGKSVPDGLYIICARYESFRSVNEAPETTQEERHLPGSQYYEFIEHLQNQSIARDLRQWIIYPVETQKIILKRLDLFEARIKRSDKKGHVNEWTPGSAELIVKLTLHAISYTFKEIGIDSDPIDAFSKSGHMRSVMKFFRDSLWETVAILNEKEIHTEMLIPGLAEFLAKHPEFQKTMREAIEKKYYRIWSISSLNYGMQFKQSIDYDSNSGKLLYPSKVGEFPLIPVIWGDIEFEEEYTFFNNHLLTKVRILQLLSQNKSIGLTFKEVKKIISSIFQKDEKKVDLLIRAAILQRMIDFDMKQDALTALMDSKLRLTDLGKAVIDQWIYIPAYNEYTMHLSAVPNVLKDEFPRFYPERTDGPLAGNIHFEYLKSHEYVDKLFATLSRWVSLIAAIEFWEMTRFKIFKEMKKRIDISKHFDFEFEPIIDKLVNNIFEVAKKIVYKADKKKESIIMKQLAKSYKIEYID